MTAPTVAAIWLDGARCPVDVRETWALGDLDADRLYRAAREAGLGACLVSTCFRVELFVSGDRPATALLAWGRRQLEAARPDAPRDGLRQAQGEPALRHLLRVAAGLESAVLGEAQILGQVRRARAGAEAAGVLDPALRAAFDAAVRTGQWARRVTDLGRGTASTASAAVQWADDAVGSLAGRDVVVIGAGQIGRLLLGRLAEADAASVTLVSAHAPAHRGFAVVRPDALAEVLPDADVVFSATDRQALDLSTVAWAWADGAERVVVDLGVPRTVDAAVGRLPGVTLADVDALGAVVDAGLAARQAAVPEVEAAIETALADLCETLAGLGREQLVADFRRRAEAIRQDTLDYVCGKCADRTCGPDRSGACSDPDLLSRTLTTRLLHDVTTALRSGAGDDAALRRLLHLDDDA
ncbi:glutamyl-tRNA reductase [Rubrivirga sp.]|uniref:glutamyl-tRNA reductase n=1 Tax=Rubrivirga sp. TaxID=1885344 RepID=UPI003B51DED9